MRLFSRVFRPKKQLKTKKAPKPEAKVESFQSNFLKEDDRIGLLRNDVAELDKILVREICEDGKIINKVDTHENLYFISAGSLPENPTELLANGKVNSLIDYLESNFDMVVIDTSPAVLVTDAYILSGMCDATLYVIRHNYTPKMLIKRIDENNQINPINNAAIVFNGVKTRGVFKNNYGYGYDYVYGNKERGSKTKKAS